MTGFPIRGGLAATVLTGIVAASGCGVGPGEAGEGDASLTVSRDYGADVLTEATLAGPTSSDTVVRFLDANAEIDTEYGGNFVSAIDGLEGSTVDGGPQDWFFFVNGLYSDLGAGEVEVAAGDRIWWDYRRWSEAYRVPVVVGSFPEPFLEGEGDAPPQVAVECLTDPEPCERVLATLEAAGVGAELRTVTEPSRSPDETRVLVGPWQELRSDPAAAAIEEGPGVSGVYAGLEECAPGDWELEILGSDAQARDVVSAGGFVAAVRRGEDAPTFVVAGTDDDTVSSAAELFDAGSLADRYAVAGDAGGGEDLPMPAADDAPRVEAGCE